MHKTFSHVHKVKIMQKASEVIIINERNRYPMSLIIKFAVESNEFDERLALLKINNPLSSD